MLLPHFESTSTVVRKQVVLTLAELRYAMDVRLSTQCALYEISYEGLIGGRLNPGREKLVQIYFERLLRDHAGELNEKTQGSEGCRPFYEESSSSGLLNSTHMNANTGSLQANLVSDTTSNATFFTVTTTSNDMSVS